MKNSILFLIVLLFFNCCRTNKPVAGEGKDVSSLETPVSEQQNISYSDQSTWLLGYIKPERLFQPPHSEWYLKGYDDYQFKIEFTDRLKVLDKTGITVKIVLGTWCPDSRREVPRFMRIMDVIDFPRGQMEFIGVDNVKISPIENYADLAIERVPTFIFFRNNVEAGRIIENPVTSLEQDIVNILIRNEN